MNWYEIKVRSKKDIAESLTTLFIINGIDDLLIEDNNALNDLIESGITWDYLDHGLEDDIEDTITYKGHYQCNAKDSEELLLKIKNGIKEMSIDTIDCSIYKIDSNLNLEKWKEYFKPFEICPNLIICPSWETYEVKGQEQVLLMDPGSAFGTGTHETTSLCARFISQYVRGGESILDVGCGSGILAIISLMKGAKKAKAVDLDELAIKATIENAEKNKVSDKISVEYHDRDYGSDYDIIVCNLTSPILIDLSERIRAASKKETYLICSGILTIGKKDVIDCYTNLGYNLIEDESMGEWTGLVFIK